MQAHLREVNHALSRMLDGLSKAEGELPEAVSYRIQSQAVIAALEAEEVMRVAKEQADTLLAEAKKEAQEVAEEARLEFGLLNAESEAEDLRKERLEQAEREARVTRRRHGGG